MCSSAHSSDHPASLPSRADPLRDCRGCPRWSGVIRPFGSERSLALLQVGSEVHAVSSLSGSFPVASTSRLSSTVESVVFDVHCWSMNTLSFHGLCSPSRSFLRRRVFCSSVASGPFSSCAPHRFFHFPRPFGPECGIPSALPRWPSCESARFRSCVPVAPAASSKLALRFRVEASPGR